MQTVDDQQLLLLIQVDRLLLASLLADGYRKPLLEVVTAVEDLRQQKVEQGPQLSQVILQRSSSQQQAMSAVVLLAQDSGEFAFGIFHLMALVDDDVFPVVFVEPKPVLEHEVVGGDADVPFCALH
jgi:hypothetical protein